MSKTRTPKKHHTEAPANPDAQGIVDIPPRDDGSSQGVFPDSAETSDRPEATSSSENAILPDPSEPGPKGSPSKRRKRSADKQDIHPTDDHAARLVAVEGLPSAEGPGGRADSNEAVAVHITTDGSSSNQSASADCASDDLSNDDSASDITPESVIEAVLFSSDVPLSAAKLADVLGAGDASDVKRHVDALNERYAQTGASFRIEAIAKGYQMLTLPAYNHWLARLHKARSDSRLSAAALETLAVVAYKQPVLRADIETIRGVAVGDMLVRLRDANLVRIVGRAEEIGRPLLYGTTTKFLEVFGLRALEDLPKLEENRASSIPTLQLPEASETPIE